MLHCKVCGNDHRTLESVRIWMTCDYCDAELRYEDATDMISYMCLLTMEVIIRALRVPRIFLTGGIVGGIEGGSMIIPITTPGTKRMEPANTYHGAFIQPEIMNIRRQKDDD